MNNSNKQQDFQWTDELVREIVGIAHKDGYHSIQETNLDNLVNKFKQEKQQPIVEDRIVVKNLWCASKSRNEYWFNTSKTIPEEKHEAVKQAIEGVLNNETIIAKSDGNGGYFLPDEELAKLKIPTIERQDSKEDKPEWEILTFVNPNIVTDVPNGNVEKYNSYAVLRNYPIHSVKRLSDNVIFSIGDKVNWCENSSIIISGFKIDGKRITVYEKDFKSIFYEIHGLTKILAPKEEQKPIPFEKELEQLINRHSMENSSDTPDYILAKYLYNCLQVFNDAVTSRDISKN